MRVIYAMIPFGMRTGHLFYIKDASLALLQDSNGTWHATGKDHPDLAPFLEPSLLEEAFHQRDMNVAPSGQDRTLEEEWGGQIEYHVRTVTVHGESKAQVNNLAMRCSDREMVIVEGGIGDVIASKFPEYRRQSAVPVV